MRNMPDCLDFTVRKHDSGWAVESGGHITDQGLEKDEAKAAAHKRATAARDGGRPCRVLVSGEHGFI